MTNAINWFEIPASDFARAVSFYSTVLGQELRTGTFMGIPHGFFPSEGEGVGGAIVSGPDAAPSTSGPLLYLNAVDTLEQIVARVVPAGGQVLMAPTSIGEQGAMAVMLDTEGNRVGLHAPPQ